MVLITLLLVWHLCCFNSNSEMRRIDPCRCLEYGEWISSSLGYEAR